MACAFTILQSQLCRTLWYAGMMWVCARGSSSAGSLMLQLGKHSDRHSVMTLRGQLA